MDKVIYNLLVANSTSEPITLSSTAGVETFASPIIENRHSGNGVAYIQIGTLSGITGDGFTPKLYHSFNRDSWFLNTALPTVDTTSGYSVELSGLGKFIRFSYAVNSITIKARAIIELFDERN